MGAQSSQQPKVFQLISNGEASKIKDLMRNDPQALSKRSLGGETVLHFAVVSEPGDEAKCMNSLLDGSGFDLNALNASGSTALHRAASLGRTQAMKELLMSGAKTDILNGDGQTALHLATLGNHVACIEAAAACWINMDVPNEQTQTPLHVAASIGSTACVKALLAGRADVNKINGEGQTALHIAVPRGDKDIVDALMLAGADPQIQDVMLRTPGSSALPEASPDSEGVGAPWQVSNQALRAVQT
mmetsp:Transcript_152019/g.264933  ORF Transcript_152019/g.264933 Transcript_152019/m.264933 type:complete len:245 (-) Transcript_152019:119-853(-)